MAILPIDTAYDPNFTPLPIDGEKTGGVPVPPETAELRAFKARYGLSGMKDVSYDELYQGMVTGQENEIRNKYASQVDLQKAQRKQQIISDYVSNPDNNTLDRNSFQQLNDKLNALSKPTDSGSVFEENYARQAVSNNLVRTMDANRGTSVEQAAGVIGTDNFNKITDAADEVTAKREWLLKQSQDITNAQEGRSFLGKLADLAKGLDPTYDRRKFGALFAPSGLSTELERQASEDLSLPFDKFKERVSKKLEYLKDSNPDLAAVYISHLTGASTSDVFLGNTLDSLNLLNIGQFGKIGVDLGVAGVKALTAKAAVTEVKEAVKDVVKGATANKVDKSTLTAATGDLGEAAVQKATSNLIKDFKGSSAEEYKAIEALPSGLRLDIKNIKENPGQLARDTVLRIEQSYNSLIDNVVERISNKVNVDRTPGFLASEQAIREYKDKVAELYPGVRNSILDISDPVHNPVSNTYSIDLAIGRPGGELFFNPQQAKQYAKVNGLSGFKLDRQGVGYYIRLTKPMNETDDIIRDAAIQTGITDTKDSFIHNYTSWLKTAENVQSRAAMSNRKTASYGPSSLIAMAQGEAKQISQLMKGSRLAQVATLGKKNPWGDWERVIKASRDIVDKVTGKPGKFFDNPVELEQFYLQTVKRLPEAAEQEAYWSYKKFLELDRILRNVAVYKNKARVGTENHTLSFTDAAQNVKKVNFDGVLRSDLPGGKDGMFIQDVPGLRKSIASGETLSASEKAKIKEALATGKVKVVEIWDPETRPLAGFSRVKGERIRYVITDAKNLETKPISWEQVPRAGGGHFEYSYQNWIKQARVNFQKIGGRAAHWYEGDTTVMPVSLRKMGADIVEHMNNARLALKQSAGATDKAIKANYEAAARAIVESKLDMPWKDFKGWFQKTRNSDTKELMPPRLDINEPFVLTPNNKNIGDLSDALANRYPGTFQDGTKTGSLARQYQVAYTSERDAINMQTYRDIGKKGEPVYKLEPAELVDPIPSMNRALQRITQSAYMDDYKVFAVEHWLEQAKSYLKTRSGSADEIRYSPFWYFHNPEFRTGVDPNIKSQLMSQHWQIERMVGTASNTDAILHSISQKIADSAYSGLGPKLGTKLDPDWMLSKLRDPFRFARNVTFHLTMGLFSIPTMWTQLQTHFIIQSIAGPVKASQGAAASFLYVRSMINRHPEILEHLDSVASKIGWKKGEWLEAMRGLEDSGFGKVGGEYQNINNLLQPNLIKGYKDAVLDAGTLPFRMGEANVRHAAWFTAYKEYRDAVPHGALSNKDWLKILNRADTLNGNMSRASASVLNTGPLSLTTQFLTYQLRLGELFFSNRLAPEWKNLSTTEMNMIRARMLGVSAALYGVPMSLGVTGIPLYDYLRQKAIENGYVMGENYFHSVFMEGLPSVALAWITGKGDIQKGNWYNVPEKLGAQGFQTLWEVLRGDKSTWNIVGGAAWSKFSNIIEAIHPLFTFFASAVRDDDKYFPFDPNIFLDVAKEASTGNIIHRSIVAAQTGKWFTKKDQLQVEGITPWNALFLAITGFQPQEAVDLHAFYASNKDQEEAQKQGLNHFLLYGRRALNAVESNDQATYTSNMQRALAWLKISDYPEDKMGGAWSLLYDQNTPAAEKIPWDWAFKKPVSDAERAKRSQSQIIREQLQNKRKGIE